MHTLLLWGAYCLPIRQWTSASSGYTIELPPARSHQKDDLEDTTNSLTLYRQLTSGQANSKNKVIAATATKEDKTTVPEDTVPGPQDISGQSTLKEPVEDLTKATRASNVSTHLEDASKTAIDERSLYQASQDEQTGPLLELAGWIWDTVPQPKDHTEESGKIVFQIKIDEFGEVIAVKTLEKTVSPLLESIYRESLIGLTFSKTADNRVHAPISTGRVTFILQVK
ncbi:MAG: hypothetical protein ACX93T_03005 [Bacteroidota bacterium]